MKLADNILQANTAVYLKENWARRIVDIVIIFPKTSQHSPIYNT